MLELKRKLLEDALSHKTTCAHLSESHAGTDDGEYWKKEAADWEKIYNMLEAEVQQLEWEDFKRHMADTLSLKDIDEDKFDNLDWTISFNGKQVTIYNCAAAFNAVDDLLKDMIEGN